MPESLDESQNPFPAPDPWKEEIPRIYPFRREWLTNAQGHARFVHSDPPGLTARTLAWRVILLIEEIERLQGGVL